MRDATPIQIDVRLGGGPVGVIVFTDGQGKSPGGAVHFGTQTRFGSAFASAAFGRSLKTSPTRALGLRGADDLNRVCVN